MSEPRYLPQSDLNCHLCEDCGCLVADLKAHTRFHSILNGTAHAVAILVTAHIAAHVHDKYEAYDKIKAYKFDNWSADALDEIIAEHDAADEAES